MVLENKKALPLTAQLSDGFEVTHVSETPKAVNMLRQERFDVIIVDRNLPKVAEACQLINETVPTPLVLTTNGHQTDWEKLRDIEVDGFLPEKAEKSELVARLRAISRGSINKKGVARDENY